jgi:hypothetical protein
MNQPNPATLVLARIVIFLQLGLPLIALAIGAAGLIQGEDQTRAGLIISFGMLVVVLTVLVGLTTTRGRPVAWIGAVLLQIAFAAAYAYLVYWAQVEPSPEGMLAFSGLVIGAPLVLLSLVGLGLLVAPATVRYCLRRP